MGIFFRLECSRRRRASTHPVGLCGNVFRCLIWLALAGSLRLTVDAATITWNGAGDGTSWASGANWQGGAAPGSGDDAVIGTGSTQIVVSTSVQVHSVATGQPLQIATGGTLQAATTIAATALITLNGGTVNGGTIEGGASAATMNTTSSGTLEGISVGGSGLTLIGSPGLFYVTNGVTLVGGATLTLQSASNANVQTYWKGSQTIGGTGTFILTGPAQTIQLEFSATPAASGSLTIGSGVTVEQPTGSGAIVEFLLTDSGDSIVNNGAIEANASTSGSTPNFSLGSSGNTTLTNLGTISAQGGAYLAVWNLAAGAGSITSTSATLELGGTINNLGTITATNSTIDLGTPGGGSSSFTLAGLGALSQTGSTTYLNQTLLNAGTLALNSTTGPWVMNGGTIQGGAVTVSGTTLSVGNQDTGTLIGVTLDSNLTVGGGTLDVQNGLTLGSGATVTVQPGTTTGGALVFEGTQTLGGTGTVLLTGTSALNAAVQLTETSGAATLTIGSGVTIEQPAGATAAAALRFTATADTIVNDGTVIAESANGTFTLGNFGPSGSYPIVNNGAIEVQSGGTMALWNLTGGTGTVTVNAGTLTLEGFFDNTGTIALQNNGTLNLGTPNNPSVVFNYSGVGNIQRSGGAVNVTGIMNLGGATLNLAGNNASLGLTDGGTIENGTLTTSGSAAVTIPLNQTATLNAITFSGNLTVQGGGLMVTGGLTLENGATVTIEDTPSGGGYELGYVIFKGTQTLAGDGTIDIQSNKVTNYFYVQRGTGASATLTVAPTITIVHAASSTAGAAIYFDDAGDSLVNEGAILAATGTGESLSIGYPNDGSFVNEGSLSAPNGETLILNSPFSVNGSGIMNTNSLGAIDLYGNLLGSTTAIPASALQGPIVIEGNGSSTSPQLLEAMSNDQGAVAAGFTNNFAYGPLTVASGDYVELEDQSQNVSGGSSSNAVYAQSVTVQAAATLNLNGLHLYAYGLVNNGTITGGTVTQVPVIPGALTLGTPAPGNLTLGVQNAWTFYEAAGQTVTVQVVPGSQLQYAAVTLEDPNGNILATGQSGNAGATVLLSQVALLTSGTYTVLINAPTGAHSSAIGPYTAGVYTANQNVQTLNLGQLSLGNLISPFTVDEWSFAAAAGEQVQFDVLGGAGNGIQFELSGPNGYVGFQNLGANSPLLTLPSSGSYTVIVSGVNGATGAYAFEMEEPEASAQSLAGNFSGMWAGAGQAQYFKVTVNQLEPLLLQLSGMSADAHAEIFASLGVPPTRETYDFAATGPGVNQSLLVPAASAGTWYIMVYGDAVTQGGTFTLTADESEVFLSAASPGSASTTSNVSLSLTGAGFLPGTQVELIGTGGAYSPASTTVISPTQIAATYNAGSLPAGVYTVKVVQPDQTSAQLASAVTIVAGGQAVLTTNVILPNPIGRHIASIIYVDYANTGTAPMPAPLLVLSAVNPLGQSGALMTLNSALQTSGFWTTATPAGYSQSVQILASGSTPGVLAPGESGRVLVYYGGWLNTQWDFTQPTLTFSLTTVQANDPTPVNWAADAAATQPPAFSTPVWNILYASLATQMGTTAGGYVQMLDALAAYLGNVGENVYDASQLWNLAIAQANNEWPVGTLGSAVDDTLPMPGPLAFTFGRAFNASISGRYGLGPLGLGWFTPWQRSMAVGSDGTVTLSEGDGAQFTYQPDSRNPGQYFSQPGDTSLLTSNNNGFTLTNANGIVSTFALAGFLQSVADTNGNKIAASYSNGQLTELAETLGGATQSTYTLGYASGLLTSLTDSAGRVTTYGYDAGQHLTSVTGYNGMTTSYAYDETSGSPSQNALTSITLPDGTHRSFTYDSQGRLTGAAADGGAFATTFAYTNGQVAATNAVGNTYSLFYDQNGLVAKTVDALGNPTFYTHDVNFNLTQVTNALGASALFTYDTAGQVTTATDFLGNASSYAYGGPQGQLTERADPNGNATVYAYSGGGSLLTATWANGATQTFTYDPLGDALSYVNPGGTETQYTHNAGGQLTGVAFADGSTYAYTYDGEGKLLTAVDASGTTSFTYNATTRLLAKVAYPSGGYLTFTYDSGGRRTQMADQTGYAVNYAYNAAGLLGSLTDGNGNALVTYTYDAAGRLTQKANGNGTSTTYQYDANSRIAHVINSSPGNTVNSRFDDTYNALGLKATEANLYGTWTYTYDSDGQLTQAVFASKNPGLQANQNLQFTYDGAGNRTSAVVNGVPTAYTVNNLNQYTSVGGTAYGYDANGDLTSDGVNAYAFDAIGRVKSVATGSGTTTYATGALGQRVSSTSGGVTTLYEIDPAAPGNVVGAYVSGSLVARHNYGLGLVEAIQGSNSYYYDFDPLGSTAGLSNSSGAYANTYLYLPFGSSQGSTGSVNDPYQYAGQSGIQTDGTGVDFMRARYYSPAIGRFLSQDPLGISAGDSNLYRYVCNEPIGLSDPSGLIAASPAGWGAGPASAGPTAALAPGLPASWTAAIVSAGPGLITASTGGALPGIGTGGAVFQAGMVNGVLTEGAAAGAASAVSASGSGSGGTGNYVAGFPTGNSSGGYSGGASTNGYSGGGTNNTNGYTNSQPNSAGGTINNNAVVETVEAMDPNALYGPAGYGAQNFIAEAGAVFPYRIDFENAVTATAPAQGVTISDPLNSNLDPSTFQLTGIGFGGFNLTPPPGATYYETTVTMTYGGQTFDVQVTAGIETSTGTVYAYFQSIDPNTDLPPSNPLVGFLPPEDGTGRGQGYVSFTVSPKSSVPSGTMIPNVAEVTFDSGVPIATDLVNDEDPSQGVNPAAEANVTIDASTPTAQISLPAAESSPSFLVSWSGSDDDGSGIASYTVYVSANSGPYTVWQSNTTATSATYNGTLGNAYTFYVVATSNTGYVQNDPQSDAVTTRVTTSPAVTSSASPGGTVGASFTYAASASGGTAPYTFTTSGFAQAGLTDITGSSSGIVGGTPTTAGTFDVTVAVTDSLGDTGSLPATLTIAAGQATVNLGDLAQTYTGEPLAAAATTNPTDLTVGFSYAGTGSTSYGPSATAPTEAGTYAVTGTISSVNYQGSASGVLTIAPATATVTLGGLAQTYTGSPLAATATTVPGDLTVTFSYTGTGGTTYGPTAAAPTSAGSYTVTGTVSSADYMGSSTGTLVISAASGGGGGGGGGGSPPGPAGQTITFLPVGPVSIDVPVTLTASASSGLPVSFTVLSGQATLSGDALTVYTTSTVTVQASQAGNASYSAAPSVVRTLTAATAGSEVYFGQVSAGAAAAPHGPHPQFTGSGVNFAAFVNAAQTAGTLVGYLSAQNEGFAADFTLANDGTFTVTTNAIVTGSATGPSLTFSGQLSDGVLSGSITPLNLPFSATLDPPSGSSSAVSGLYQASTVDSSGGIIYSIVGSQDDVFVLAATPTLVTGGTGTVGANDTYSVQAAGGVTISGSVNPNTSNVSGTVAVAGGGTVSFSGISSGTTPTNRLVNLSARGSVASGQNVLIAGFYIAGSSSKTVLLRAVGPTLANYGIADYLAQPNLQVFAANGSLVADNMGWGGNPALTATFSLVGAFPLLPDSADAAVEATLPPGGYTILISNAGPGAGGIALAEIYDVTPSAQNALPRLVNLSSRGQVGAGAGVLVAGFYVSGNAPESVLIRGIGPALGQYGVSNAVATPFLSVYDGGGNVIAENQGWGTPLTVNGQAAATAAQIAAAAQETGAFTLPAGSGDTAVILTLAPGAYTAQLSGANGATGTGMIEIYELPGQ